MPSQRWTREQDLAVLFLKLEHKGRLTPAHADVGKLARATNHSEDSIIMRKRNFDYLDASVPGGLRNTAKLTEGIWAEYERDPEGVLAEGRRAYLKFIG